MITHQIEHVALLLLIAAVVAMLARKAHLPYTVGLLLTGFGLAFLHSAPAFHLSKELIFSAFLPPLIFEAAVYLPWKELRRDLPVYPGSRLRGGPPGGRSDQRGDALRGGLGLAHCPAVRRPDCRHRPGLRHRHIQGNAVPERLKIIVEAESLFNDGTAAVAFGVALAVVQGGDLTGVGIVRAFSLTVLGGIVCGAAVACILLLLARKTDDHLIELTFTTIAAYGSFLLAEHFHLSGVLATLTAGLIVGNMGSLGAITDRGREAVGRFWEYMAFVANSLIFLLIGLSLAGLNVAHLGRTLFLAIPIVLLGRALAVYFCSTLFLRAPGRSERRYQHVLFWGGLRGALALA